MKKMLIVAPFESQGRYKGGIMYVANKIFSQQEYFKQKKIEIKKFNTCRIDRPVNNAGIISFSNINNFVKIKKDLLFNLKNESYDFIYYHSSVRLALLKDLLIIRKLSKYNHVKIMLHIHFAEFNKIMFSVKILNNIIISIMNNKLEKVIFLSEKTAQEFVKNGLDNQKVEIIYNFHDIHITPQQINNKIANQLDKNELIFLGSIDQRKGIIDLLEALTNINKEFILHICGVVNDESIRKDFNDLIMKLKNKVIVHGYVSGEQKKNLLLKSNTLILPSYGEGLPISIIEGLATGCSIITTNVGAITEVLNAKNAYIIEPGDIDHLTKSILSTLEDKDNQYKIIKENYNYSKQFTLKCFIDRLIDVCNEVNNK